MAFNVKGSYAGEWRKSLYENGEKIERYKVNITSMASKSMYSVQSLELTIIFTIFSLIVF